MGTALILLQFAIVLALIFKGARVGGIGLGIYGMVGVFILVFVFGMKPGNLPIDVMLIIVSVITAAAALQAAGGLDYLVGIGCEILAQTSYSHHLFWPVDNMAVLLGGRNSPHLLFAIAYYLGDSDKLED